MTKQDVLSAIEAILLIWFGALGVIFILPDASTSGKYQFATYATIVVGLASIIFFAWEKISRGFPRAWPTIKSIRVVDWLVAPLLILDAGVFLYVVYSSWEILSGYVCTPNGRACGYVPVVTYSNAILTLLVIAAVFFIWKAIQIVVAIIHQLRARKRRRKRVGFQQTSNP